MNSFYDNHKDSIRFDYRCLEHPAERAHSAVSAARVQKSEQTGTRFRSKAAGDFGGKRHLISLQSGT